MTSLVLAERIRQELLRAVAQTVRGVNAESGERGRGVRTLTLAPSIRKAALDGTRRTESMGIADVEEAEVARALSRRQPSQASLEASGFLSGMKEGHPYIAEAFLTDRYGINAASSKHPFIRSVDDCIHLNSRDIAANYRRQTHSICAHARASSPVTCMALLATSLSNRTLISEK